MFAASGSSNGGTASTGTPVQTTVCVVEAFTSIRQFITQFVNRIEGFRVVHAAGSFEEAEQTCKALAPQLAIVDGYMWSRTSGASLARTLRTQNPQTNVIVFCADPNPDVMQDAIDCGVAGFVLRTEPLTSLEKAIRGVVRGENHYCSEVALLLRKDGNRFSGPGGVRPPLSNRERQVLQEIARGRLTKEIADTLGMSVFGVQNVRRRISRKTGLHSIAELTLHAAKLRLVPPPGQA